MKKQFPLIILIVLVGLAFGQDATSQAFTNVTTFTVRIENISSAVLQPSDGSVQSVPLSPGVWAVHAPDAAPLFREGERDFGQGLEAIAEDGNPAQLASHLRGRTGIFSSGVFNTPIGAAEPGPLTLGNVYEFTFTASPGDYLSFATMFVPSNDLFYAPDSRGIALFDATGTPIQGVLREGIVQLWDAGTEVNQEPGVGPDQVQRQSGPDTGATENGVVQSVPSVFQGHTYPPANQVLLVSVSS